MSTPPISASIVNKIKARTQAVRWYAMLKEVRTFSAYCCNINSNGIMGVAKQPVPIVNISPNPVCLGEAIDWDLTDSYAPGSTISAWEINFGDSSSDTGASIGSAAGTHTYAAVGSYTVTVTITEGGGRTTEMAREVNVVDCSQPPDKYYYIGTYGQGVWFLNRLGELSTWEERNQGLSGDALYINSLIMRPGQEHLSDGSHELWAATLDGIYRSGNSGKNWGKITLPPPSNDEFEDLNVSATDYLKVVLDVNDVGKVYALVKGQGEVSGGGAGLVGSIVVATGKSSPVNIYTGFAGSYFFDNYDGADPIPTHIMRSSISLDGSNLPVVAGRSELLNTSSTPLHWSFYNDGLDAFITTSPGVSIVQPPSNGITVAGISGNTERWGDFVDNTNWISWDNTTGIPSDPTLIRWRDISSVVTIDSISFDNSTRGLCIQRVNATDAVCAYRDNTGNLAAKLVRIDTGTPDLIDVATATSSYPVVSPGAFGFMVRLAANDYALVYDSGSSWQIARIQTTASSVTISAPSAILSTAGTPGNIVKIDGSTIGVICLNGAIINCVSVGISGTEGSVVQVYTYPGTIGSTSLGIGYVSGHLICSYGDGNGDLRLASVAL